MSKGDPRSGGRQPCGCAGHNEIDRQRESQWQDSDLITKRGLRYVGVSKGGTHEVGGSKTQGSALDDPGVPGKKVPAFLYMIPLERWNVERKFIWVEF